MPGGGLAEGRRQRDVKVGVADLGPSFAAKAAALEESELKRGDFAPRDVAQIAKIAGIAKIGDWRLSIAGVELCKALRILIEAEGGGVGSHVTMTFRHVDPGT
jgi:hypothetical protein